VAEEVVPALAAGVVLEAVLVALAAQGLGAVLAGEVARRILLADGRAPRRCCETQWQAASVRCPQASLREPAELGKAAVAATP
jgi:hypothetical protein